MHRYGNTIATLTFARIWKIKSGVINSRHEGILNKHLCKNFFEENRMPVFFVKIRT